MEESVIDWDVSDIALVGLVRPQYVPSLSSKEKKRIEEEADPSGAITSDECDGTDSEEEEGGSGDDAKDADANCDRILGENMAGAFTTSGDSCVDFFFQVVPGISFANLWRLFDAAYEQESMTALKLACHLRGVRGTGKGDKTNMEGILIYLRKMHPKTLVANLHKFAEVGYFKDLPELLKRLVEDDENPHHPTSRPARIRRQLAPGARNVLPREAKRSLKRRFPRKSKVRRREHGEEPRELHEKGVAKAVGEDPEKIRMIKLEARAARHQRYASENERALRKYKEDEVYRAIHNRISTIFASLLQQDLRKLELGESPSLAAKWCPSVNRTHDRRTLICEAIAVKMFPRQYFPEYSESMPEAVYRFKVRDRLRKEVLVPLRKNLCLPEIYMSAREWDKVPYPRVPSVAMMNYKDFFLLHDKERFEAYLEQVKEGKAKIAAGALFPHTIVRESNNDVAALQWERMKLDLTSGKDFLQECIAISDVSGSMEGLPMEVSVALGLLISEITMEPWKGKLITFSEDPNFHLIPQDASFNERVNSIKKADWGVNTDLEKVFDLILDTAQKDNLPPSRMVKTIFIFSDMEFDEAVTHEDDWSTTYEHIVQKFIRAGYPVPYIIFWNLRASISIPARNDTSGVALVSGFSQNLIKLFFNNQLTNPRAAMDAALTSHFDGLVICD